MQQYETVPAYASERNVTRQAVHLWIAKGRVTALKVGKAVLIPRTAENMAVQPERRKAA